MKFHELNVDKSKKKTRVGRGISAGRGKTAGRGTKGQKARTGSSAKPGFSGGQNPLMQQLPKLPGFKSHIKKAENVTTTQLNSLKSTTIDSNVLFDNGLISSPYVKIKLLFSGDISKKLTIKLPAASQKAVEAIESSGGQFEKVDRLARPTTKK